MKQKILAASIFVLLLMLSMPFVSSIQATTENEEKTLSTLGEYGPFPCGLWKISLDAERIAGDWVDSGQFLLGLLAGAILMFIWFPTNTLALAFADLLDVNLCEICTSFEP